MAPPSLKALVFAALSSIALAHELKCSYGDSANPVKNVAVCDGNYVPFNECIKTVIASSAEDCGVKCRDFIENVSGVHHFCRGAMYNSVTQFCELYEDNLPGITNGIASDATDSAILLTKTCGGCGVSDRVLTESDCTQICTKQLQHLTVTTDECMLNTDNIFIEPVFPFSSGAQKSARLVKRVIVGPGYGTCYMELGGKSACSDACEDDVNCKQFFIGSSNYCYLLNIAPAVASSSSSDLASSSSFSALPSSVSSSVVVSSSSAPASSSSSPASSVPSSASLQLTSILSPTSASIPISATVVQPSASPSASALTGPTCGSIYTSVNGARYDIQCNGPPVGTVILKRTAPARPESACQAKSNALATNALQARDVTDICPPPQGCGGVGKRDGLDKRACVTASKAKRQIQGTTFTNCIATCNVVTGCQSVLYIQGLCYVFTCTVSPPPGYAAAIKLTDQIGNVVPRTACPLAIQNAGSNGATRLTTTSNTVLNVIVAVSADISVTVIDTLGRGVGSLQGLGPLAGARIEQDQSIEGAGKRLHCHTDKSGSPYVHTPGEDRLIDCKRCSGYTGLLAAPLEDEHSYKNAGSAPSSENDGHGYIAPGHPVDGKEKPSAYDQTVPSSSNDGKQQPDTYNDDKSGTSAEGKYKGPLSNTASRMSKTSDFGLVIGALILGMCL